MMRQVTTLSEIQQLIAELDPALNPPSGTIDISTELKIANTDYRITASAPKQNKRDILVAGLKIIKDRFDTNPEDPEELEINGKNVKFNRVDLVSASYLWVDKFIAEWFGAFRDGYHITWDLTDGFRYKYDIFRHKLSRTPR